MWNLLSSVEPATATVDFTNELSWFVTGLIAVMSLSMAAMAAIMFTALDGRKDGQLLQTAVLKEVSYQEAA